MRFRGVCRGLVVATALALVTTGSAAADDEQRGIDPNQGRSLVEVNLADKAAAIQLQLKAEQYGVDFNEHYLRRNANGSVTVTVFGTEDGARGTRTRPATSSAERSRARTPGRLGSKTAPPT